MQQKLSVPRKSPTTLAEANVTMVQVYCAHSTSLSNSTSLTPLFAKNRNNTVIMPPCNITQYKVNEKLALNCTVNK